MADLVVARNLTSQLVVAVDQGTIVLEGRYGTTETLSPKFRQKLAQDIGANPFVLQTGTGEGDVNEYARVSEGEIDLTGYVSFPRIFAEWHPYKATALGWEVDRTDKRTSIWASTSDHIQGNTELETDGIVLANLLSRKYRLNVGWSYGISTTSIGKGQSVTPTGITSGGRITYGLADGSTAVENTTIAMHGAGSGDYLGVGPSAMVLSKTAASGLGFTLTAGLTFRSAAAGTWAATASVNDAYTARVVAVDSDSDGAVLIALQHTF